MTTRLSSKGQIVLPRQVRSKLGLQPGTQFDVSTNGETVVLVPRVKRGKVKLVTDPKTGLPTLIPPPGTLPLTMEKINELLADFP